MKEKLSFPADKRQWKPSPLIGQIVLVTTLNEDGTSNIATKSWVSMVAFEPPLLALGCNMDHWTAQNILRNKEFVVNVPGEDLVIAAWKIHTIPHPRPVEKVGLTARPAQTVKAPLVEECKAHLECMLYNQIEFGKEVLLLGRILAGSIDRDAIDTPDPYAIFKPVVFLEGGQYGVIENSRRVRE